MLLTRLSAAYRTIISILFSQPPSHWYISYQWEKNVSEKLSLIHSMSWGRFIFTFDWNDVCCILMITHTHTHLNEWVASHIRTKEMKWNEWKRSDCCDTKIMIFFSCNKRYLNDKPSGNCLAICVCICVDVYIKISYYLPLIIIIAN